MRRLDLIYALALQMALDRLTITPACPELLLAQQVLDDWMKGEGEKLPDEHPATRRFVTEARKRLPRD